MGKGTPHFPNNRKANQTGPHTRVKAWKTAPLCSLPRAASKPALRGPDSRGNQLTGDPGGNPLPNLGVLEFTAHTVSCIGTCLDFFAPLSLPYIASATWDTLSSAQKPPQAPEDAGEVHRPDVAPEFAPRAQILLPCYKTCLSPPLCVLPAFCGFVCPLYPLWSHPMQLRLQLGDTQGDMQKVTKQN